ETTLPVPEGNMWPVFYADAAAAHVATFPARRDEYGPTIRAKLDDAIALTADDATRGRDALAAWRVRAAREPDVDLFVSPVLGLEELPPAGVDELEVRVAMSGYARAFSFLGWPAIAIGNVQLAGRDAGVVLGAALALEREGAV